MAKQGIGQAETSNELGKSFLLAMGTGVAFIYIVLVLLFRSRMPPVTIFGVLLLSMPGMILALLLTGTHLSMPAMIGRHDHANGHCHQELNTPGGVRHRGPAGLRLVEA